MKKVLPIGIFLIFATLTGLNSKFEKRVENFSNIIQSDTTKLKPHNLQYNIIAEIFPSEKLLKVNEEIFWKNNSEYFTDEIQLHLYVNGFANTKALLNKRIKLEEDSFTKLNFESIKVDDKDVSLEYIFPDVINKFDSTVARIKLEKQIDHGDSVKINFRYNFKIPKSTLRLGYAEGRNFFFISQWFPKLGVFKEGEWICNQFHAFTNFYSDYANYKVEITAPENYTIAATGSQSKQIIKNGKRITNFEQNNVHDFVWMVSDEIISSVEKIKKSNGEDLLLKTYVQPEKERYIERYKKAVINSLNYLEKNVGSYPYSTISIVDVPRTSKSGGMEYPTLFTVDADLFSYETTHIPESVTVHEFVHQYFYGIIGNDEVSEAWLDEGITSYFTSKILYKYYGEKYNTFKFAKYFPVFGMNLLSFEEIPIIYTLKNINIPRGTSSLRNYYRNLEISAISDTSYKVPFLGSYFTHANYKPEIMLMSLEKILGEEKFKLVFKEYYNKYKFKHATGKDFIQIVKNHTDKNLDWFFNSVYYSSNKFDYRIKFVNKIDKNKYQVFCERLEEGVFENEIALYTESDTLIQKWDGKSHWKTFEFETDKKVIAAEIDPQKYNLFDINFSNNSYTIDKKHWASISLSIRWFFWVQNALMILGSIG